MNKHTSKNIVIALALISACGLVVTRRVLPWVVDQTNYTDGQKVYTATRGEGIRYAVWDAPEPVPGDVNTSAREGRATLSPDGRWMVFTVGEEGLNTDLYIAEVVGGEPRDPRPLGGVNSDADDLAPMFGERALYFASNRAGGRGGYDLYASAWDGYDLAPPEALGGELNTEADELDPAPIGTPGTAATDGRFAWSEALCFASNRAEGGRGDFDLFLAQAGVDELSQTDYVAVQPLTSLNTAFEEREPSFTADARTLFFCSDRDEESDFDLYRSVLEHGTWLPPLPLDGLNTLAAERAPYPSQDGFALYFQREGLDPSGAVSDAGDLHRARSIELFRLPPEPVGWLDLLLLGALLVLALLAWLAKRWEGLDILYKCFLASLIAHLLLMWLLREVYPENEAVPLGPGPEPTFRVRVLSNRNPTAGLRERGGALELARAESTPEERLERAATDSLAPTEARVAPSVGRLEHAAAHADAPARAQSETVREAFAETTAAPNLLDRVQPIERRRGAAPEVAIVASEVRAERGEIQTLDPARTATRVSAAERRPEPAPGPATVRRSENRELRELRYAPAAALPGAVARTDQRGPDLQAPVETRELRAEPAPEPGLPLPSETPATTPERSQLAAAAPTRRDVPAFAMEPSAAAPRRPERMASLARAESTLPTPPRFTPTAAEPSAPAAPVRSRGPELARPEEDLGRSRALEPERPLTLPEPTGLALERGTPSGPGSPDRVARPAPTQAPVERPEPTFRPLTASPPERARELPTAPQREEPEPYRSRFGSEKEVALETFGGGEDTERAVAQGLAYLAGRQKLAGHWGDLGNYHAKYRQVIVGNTGLALLAFLGAGHTHSSETVYSDNVERAIAWLLSMQDRRTGHFGNSSSYSHGVTTYALAECYAITRDPRLRRPLERAVEQILRHQVTSDYRGDERLVGGWSYYYPDGAIYDAWPRVSITSWQVMALESAKLGGLEVPERALRDAEGFLLRSWDSQLGAMRYSHDPDRLRSGYPTLPGSTPAALFALSIMGDDISTDRYRAPRDFVMRRLPRGFEFTGEDDFVFRAQGNVYFWYYGSLAMLRAGGDSWERWNTALKETLLPAQQENGSWRPLDVYAEYAGDSRGESVYTTAMCVLTLEVYYRYFTPLLQK